MACPHCHGTLRMTQREGTEIDYRPQHRGVWLDRGKLDKNSERSATWTSSAEPSERAQDAGGRDDRGDAAPSGKKRKGSFVGELSQSFGDFGLAGREVLPAPRVWGFDTFRPGGSP